MPLYSLVRATPRERGFTLLEVAIAISLFILIAVPVSITLLRGMQHGEQSHQQYVALNALRDLIAEMQEVANLPQDLPNQEGIGAIYARYHDQSIPIPDLTSGSITVVCFPNESGVPGNLGGPQDLNFDGDATDDLGNQSNGSDLKLVPMTLTIQYTDRGGTYTITKERLLTKTTN